MPAFADAFPLASEDEYAKLCQNVNTETNIIELIEKDPANPNAIIKTLAK